MLISLLIHNGLSLCILLWLFKYQINRSIEMTMTRNCLNFISFAFLRSSLTIMQCVIFWLLFFREFFEDIQSKNQFEIHPKTF